MNTILIGYDLNSPGQVYDSLTEVIKELGPWWHRLDSTWLVKTELSCAGVRDGLKAHLDSGDELLAIDVTSRSWAGTGFDSYDWLKNNL